MFCSQSMRRLAPIQFQDNTNLRQTKDSTKDTDRNIALAGVTIVPKKEKQELFVKS
jgi:hypothetical protein